MYIYIWFNNVCQLSISANNARIISDISAFDTLFDSYNRLFKVTLRCVLLLYYARPITLFGKFT